MSILSSREVLAATAVTAVVFVALGWCAWRASSGFRVRRWQEGLRRDLARWTHPSGGGLPPRPVRRRARRLGRGRVHALVATEWPHLLACMRGEHCHENDGLDAHFSRLADEVAPDTARDFNDGGTQ